MMNQMENKTKQEVSKFLHKMKTQLQPGANNPLMKAHLNLLELLNQDQCAIPLKIGGNVKKNN